MVVKKTKVSKALQATQAGPSDGAGTVWSQFGTVGSKNLCARTDTVFFRPHIYVLINMTISEGFYLKTKKLGLKKVEESIVLSEFLFKDLFRPLKSVENLVQLVYLLFLYNKNLHNIPTTK